MFEDLLKEIEATQEARRPTTGPEEPLDLTREDHRAEALAAAGRGDAVLVVSATLGEAVYWVRDERSARRLKRAPDYQGEVCYTLTELRELSGQSPDLLKAVHQFKRTFGATLQKTTKEGGACRGEEDIEVADTKVGALVSAEGKTTT